jgi:hypothetical protein
MTSIAQLIRERLQIIHGERRDHAR